MGGVVRQAADSVSVTRGEAPLAAWQRRATQLIDLIVSSFTDVPLYGRSALGSINGHGSTIAAPHAGPRRPSTPLRGGRLVPGMGIADPGVDSACGPMDLAAPPQRSTLVRFRGSKPDEISFVIPELEAPKPKGPKGPKRTANKDFAPLDINLQARCRGDVRVTESTNAPKHPRFACSTFVDISV